MISFLHPYILLLIPFALLIRILFKKNNAFIKHYVPHIYFWKSVAPVKTAIGASNKTDPLWILSALILSFIVISLAKPVYLTNKPELIVWLDTSESMFSREGTVSRIMLGLSELVKEMKKNGINQFHLRLLGKPHYNLSVDIRSLNIRKLVAGVDFSSPARITKYPHIGFDSHKKYWLITDGSEPGMQSWVDASQISKVINVGHQTENTEISYMAIRKSLSGKYYDGFVKIINHGLRPSQRSLVIRSGNKLVLKKTIHIVPGHSLIENFSTKLSTRNPLLVAQISPDDSLDIDDKLILGKIAELTKKMSVQFEGNCPEIIHRIISTYPNLFINNTNTRADLLIICGNHLPKSIGPYFYICDNNRKYPLDGYPSWNTNKRNLNDIYIDPNEVMANAIIANSPHWANLLTYGKHTLIRLNEHRKSLEMYINLAHSSITKKLIFPIIINDLLGILLNKSLLDSHAIVRQTYNDSNIIPVKIHRNPYQLSHTAYNPSISNVFLILAVVLLIIEALATHIRYKPT